MAQAHAPQAYTHTTVPNTAQSTIAPKSTVSMDNTDSSLLLDRIKNAPLNQQGMDFVSKALGTAQNWQGLNQAGLLVVAGVAEQFGLINHAHSIYNCLHKRFPSCMAAWQLHFELLLTLEKSSLAETLVAMMERHFEVQDIEPFQKQLKIHASKASQPNLAPKPTATPETDAEAYTKTSAKADKDAPTKNHTRSATQPSEQSAKQSVAVPAHITSSTVCSDKQSKNEQPEPAIAPAVEKTFIAFQNEQQNTALFQSLFRGRRDVFARQWADKSIGKAGYVPINQPLTGQDIEDHLAGKRSYGIYLLDHDSMVSNGVIDLDLIPELRTGLTGQDKTRIRKETIYLFRTIKDRSENAGIQLIWEISGGKGYHIWLIMDNPVPAQEMRRALHRLCAGLANDCTCFSMEIFPKQDRLTGKGYGNLVKLPLGVHRLSGNRSRFCALQDNNTITGYSEPFGPLKTFIPTTREQLALLAEQNSGGAKLVAFPAKESASQRTQAKNAPSHQALQQGQKTQYFPEFQRPSKLAIPASIQGLLSKCAPIHTIVDSLGRTRQLSINEEKVLLGVLRFLPGGKEAIHELMAVLPEYNRALVDYKISRVRGTVLGCKRIHRLLEHGGVACSFSGAVSYEHPLCHFPELLDDLQPVAEKVENLQDALGQLRHAITQTERYL